MTCGAPRDLLLTPEKEKDKQSAEIPTWQWDLSCWTSKTCWTTYKNSAAQTWVSCKLFFAAGNRLRNAMAICGEYFVPRKRNQMARLKWRESLGSRTSGQWILNWHLTMKKHPLAAQVLTPLSPRDAASSAMHCQKYLPVPSQELKLKVSNRKLCHLSGLFWSHSSLMPLSRNFITLKRRLVLPHMRLSVILVELENSTQLRDPFSSQNHIIHSDQLHCPFLTASVSSLSLLCLCSCLFSRLLLWRLSCIFYQKLFICFHLVSGNFTWNFHLNECDRLYCQLTW